MIECITDVEGEMYELICGIPDWISDDEIFEPLETAIGGEGGE